MSLTFTLNNTEIVLNDNDIILLEIGYKNGSYKPNVKFLAKDLPSAVFHYNCLNIANGYKKRMRINNKVVAQDKT